MPSKRDNSRKGGPDKQLQAKDLTVADYEDLERAQKKSGKSTREKPLWQRLGPGLITGAADDDPSGVGTFSVAGARYGYSLLWMVPVCLPPMIAIQEMCGRIGAVTGKGLAAVIKERFPPWVLWGALVLLVIANTINIWADLNVMASAANMLFHVPSTVCLVGITVFSLVLMIAVPYKLYVRYLKWLCLALLAYAVTLFWPGVNVDLMQSLKGLFIPQLNSDPDYLLMIIGLMGTTISPYLFFWQSGQTVEEEIADGKAMAPGKRTKPVSREEIKSMRADTVVGMVVSQLICLTIMMCTAAVLHAHGQHHIESAQDAAKALLPLGPAAYVLFTLGILGTGLLAIPTMAGACAYAISETMDWRYGLYRRFSRARMFYLILGAVMLAGFLLNFVHAISPVQGLVLAAVVNGALAPPLILIVLMICNDKRALHEHTNRPISNLVGGLTLLGMSAGTAYFFWALAAGKLF